MNKYAFLEGYMNKEAVEPEAWNNFLVNMEKNKQKFMRNKTNANSGKTYIPGGIETVRSIANTDNPTFSNPAAQKAINDSITKDPKTVKKTDKVKSINKG